VKRVVLRGFGLIFDWSMFYCLRLLTSEPSEKPNKIKVCVATKRETIIFTSGGHEALSVNRHFPSAKRPRRKAALPRITIED
jgi:hypothetical protein